MDQSLLTALISVGVSFVTSVLHKMLTTPASNAGSNTRSPASSPADPLAGLPGLPGHPVLNLILPWLNGLISNPAAAPARASVAAPAPADNAQKQAAMSALANLIAADLGTLQQMQTLLAGPSLAKPA